MIYLRIILLMSTLMVCFSFVHQSASLAGMDGLTLAKKVYERDDGADSSAEMEMILIDKRGNERLRDWTELLNEVVHLMSYRQLCIYGFHITSRISRRSDKSQPLLYPHKIQTNFDSSITKMTNK